MLHIRIGYECGDRLNCDMCQKCKYKAKWYKLHNMSVAIHRFFEYKLHIKLPHLICISSKWERFSGTSKCPYHKSRNYTCYDCEYLCGEFLRECGCKERNETPYKERPVVENTWDKPCAYFKKCSWADDYKKNKKKWR